MKYRFRKDDNLSTITIKNNKVNKNKKLSENQAISAISQSPNNIQNDQLLKMQYQNNLDSMNELTNEDYEDELDNIMGNYKNPVINFNIKNMMTKHNSSKDKIMNINTNYNSRVDGEFKK